MEGGLGRAGPRGRPYPSACSLDKGTFTAAPVAGFVATSQARAAVPSTRAVLGSTVSEKVACRSATWLSHAWVTAGDVLALRASTQALRGKDAQGKPWQGGVAGVAEEVRAGRGGSAGAGPGAGAGADAGPGAGAPRGNSLERASRVASSTLMPSSLKTHCTTRLSLSMARS